MRRSIPAAWARDLARGARFAVGTGREGWARTLLTAVGVGIGVMLLLGAASVPHLMDSHQARSEARLVDANTEKGTRPGPRTLLYTDRDTVFRGDGVHGVLLRPDGPAPVHPPGVRTLPRPGEMVVSPALKELLAAPDGALLRERLGRTVVGTIAAPGLVGPGELTYYAGDDTLTASARTPRISHFGGELPTSPMGPRLTVIVIEACVVLLMPVAVFLATAVRFGGERRDRRMAALRLMGADSRMTRRMAAGEALCGALCGLVLGAGLFLLARRFSGRITVWDVNAFPSDLVPDPALTALIALAVPLCAVIVTLVALRGVTVEPLGVVRHHTPRRRRVWWRLPLPVLGAVMLLLTGRAGPAPAEARVDPYLLAGGALLVLLGITVLLPWLVEAVVARLRGGPVPWQLAVRRLQLNSGAAARAVSGITVAVAGAIALQMLLAAVQDDFTSVTGQDTSRAQLTVALPARGAVTHRKVLDEFRATEGVRGATAVLHSTVSRPGGRAFDSATPLTVGDCRSLRELARLGPCKDGDVFLVRDSSGAVGDGALARTAQPGGKVLLHGEPDGPRAKGRPPLWTVPETARTVPSRTGPAGDVVFGIFATPSAVPVPDLAAPVAEAMLTLDPRVPDAAEYARNTAARLDPWADVRTLRNTERDHQFSTVRTGLLVASTVTLALIAASMLVTTLEQLRERRRLLAVLVAFGTRRADLCWSVLWQTAVPVALGLALAVVGGCGLGLTLLRLVGESSPDWSVIWPMTGAGAALVLLVTLLSLPPLWRLMRPDGLRTE
ncbi:FtsX-like permease family protein [Streptomyces nigrescens]|uniref:FtsX-like permease family protein n=1 Tax=Streptomyces nigrescens TaxID=1920 RepID=UPI002257B3A2|nr:FtsX-like permease family protein [Streptomyces libani]MCX5445029.1 FtsX-like permease family protein [Streptomyces libani]